jgi:hypothetical protein
MLLPVILQLAPHIVMGVEKMFGHGKGVEKKQAATAMLGDAVNILAQSQGLPGANSDILSLIDDCLEAIVKYMNASGQFTHGVQNP